MLGVQRQASERILQKLQEHPDAWTRVDSVLEHSKSQQAKFYALQVRHVLQGSTLLTFLVFGDAHQHEQHAQCMAAMKCEKLSLLLLAAWNLAPSVLSVKLLRARQTC